MELVSTQFLVPAILFPLKTSTELMFLHLKKQHQTKWKYKLYNFFISLPDFETENNWAQKCGELFSCSSVIEKSNKFQKLDSWLWFSHCKNYGLTWRSFWGSFAWDVCICSHQFDYWLWKKRILYRFLSWWALLVGLLQKLKEFFFFFKMWPEILCKKMK